MDIEAIAAMPAAAFGAFSCHQGHGLAGEVRLHGAGTDWVVVVDSFLSMTSVVGPEEAAEVRLALGAADPHALFRIDLEFAPFYCPACDVCYCRDCWRTRPVFDDEMPGWYEETRGTCPNGHERMLMD